MPTRLINQWVLGAVTNLDAVTVATDGAAVDMQPYDDLSVFINVSVNTGAVTVKIEASYSGAFAGEEVELDSKIWAAVTGTDLYCYTDHLPYVRVTTSTHANATVSAVICGKT
jgi:hypothetical protein